MIRGVEVSFLNPPVSERRMRRGRDSLFLNNQSLVMKLKFKNIDVLLAADIGEEAEYRMMRGNCQLKADILKIPHHGSVSSSTPAFIQRVKPTYAILSVGERTIGNLPHPEVLRRYQELGAKIFRTDKQGAITVKTDGEKIEIKPFLSGQ